MLKEEKIRDLIEDELLYMERFATEKKTNIYKNHLVEFDRRVQRVSTLFEVLEEAPSEDFMNIVKVVKDKLG